MRANPSWQKQIVKLGLILIMGASMNAEAGLFSLFGGSEKWKEEVQLGDGQIIVIDREAIRERGGDEWAFNRSGSKAKEYRIRFFIPGRPGEMIEWRSTKISPGTWPEVPLVLDVYAGQPAVFTLVATSIGCEAYSKYVYQNGAWKEEPLPEQFEPRMTNLFLKLGVDMPAFINLESKKQVNSSGSYRRSLKQVGPMLKVCG